MSPIIAMIGKAFRIISCIFLNIEKIGKLCNFSFLFVILSNHSIMLEIYHFFVLWRICVKFTMVSFCDDASFFHEIDGIDGLDCRESMSNDDTSAIFHQMVEC